METEFKTVNKEDFIYFVQNYGKPLERDVAQMFEPPLITYNDFSDGKVWPESVVAKIIMREAYKEENEYSIIDDANLE